MVTPGEDGVTDFKAKQVAYATGILGGPLRKNSRVWSLQPGSSRASHEDFRLNSRSLLSLGPFTAAPEASISLVTMARKSKATRRNSG